MNFNQNICLISLILILMTSFSADAAPRSFVGSDKCKVCHAEQYTSWEKTRMGTAFGSLIPLEKRDIKEKIGLDPLKDYTIDPDCLSCHTTGFGRRGGFENRMKSSNLTSVGCEMCHGPGSEYIEIMITKKGFNKDDLTKAGLKRGEQETCTLCHKKNRSHPLKESKFRYQEQKNIDQHILLKK